MGEEYEVQIKLASQSIIKDQIECGIDIITDGEVRRENYIHYHCRHLSGIDFQKLTKKTARTGNYDCWLPTITNKVEFNGSFLNKEYELNQSISKNPIKNSKRSFLHNIHATIFIQDAQNLSCSNHELWSGF